jgi:hypothetical protein
MQSKSSPQSKVSEHEKNNEGGREFGHVHQPTQAEQASRNSGEADDTGQQQQHQQLPPIRRQPEQPHPFQKKKSA